MNYDFCTPAECRELAKAIATEKGLRVIYHHYTDNLLGKTNAAVVVTNGVTSFNPMYDAVKFGLTETSIKRMKGEIDWNNGLVFYAKQKGVSVTYTFRFGEAEVERKIAVVDRSHLFAHLKRITDALNLGVISGNVKDKNRTRKEEVLSLNELKDTYYQISNLDQMRAKEKHELSFYMPAEECYLNLKFKTKIESRV